MSESNLIGPIFEGAAAAVDGEPETANPHPKGSEEHDRWLIGYNETLFTTKIGETLDAT